MLIAANGLISKHEHLPVAKSIVGIPGLLRVQGVREVEVQNFGAHVGGQALESKTRVVEALGCSLGML